MLRRNVPKGPQGQKRPADAIQNAVRVMPIAAMRLILTSVFSVLALSTVALAQAADTPYPLTYPHAGPYVGNPDTVYCRLPEAPVGTRLKPVCMTNAEWARYPRYGGQIISTCVQAPNSGAPVCR